MKSFYFRSHDGRLLVVSSTDGYCSIVYFQEGELGKVYKGSTSIKNIPETKTTKKVRSEKNKTNAAEDTNADKKDVFLELDTDAMDIDITKCKNVSEATEIPADNTDTDAALLEETEDIQLVYKEDSTMGVTSEVKKTPPKTIVPNVISAKTPRRVKLITLSSPKRGKTN